MKRLREQADSAKAQDITEQEEAEQAMQDGARVNGANGVHVSGKNGYGDQSHVFGGQGDRPMTDDGSEGRFLRYTDENGGRTDEPRAMDMSQLEEADASLYPDPSLVARQRIGMGYYEPDDAPDKILFDPFQAPPEDAMRPSEPDIPEFVKKSIRAAKRKARRENEDPDFVVGKSHHKKPRLANEPETDFLDSMDPALFNGSPSDPEAVMDPPSQTDRNQSTMQDVGMDVARGASDATPAPGPSKKRTQLLFDANEPELRHAKPITSYVEAEMDSDEFEEEPNQQTKTSSPENGAKTGKKSAVDLAADAVRALFGSPISSSPQPFIEMDSTPGTDRITKRRGRPPKKASSVAQSTSIDTSHKSKNGQKGWPRGRPRKTRLSQVAAAGGSAEIADETSQTQDGSSDVEHDRMVAELEFHLAAELTEGASAPITEPGQRRRRGRPRKSGVTTIAAASVPAGASEGDAEDESRTSRSARRTRSAI